MRCSSSFPTNELFNVFDNLFMQASDKVKKTAGLVTKFTIKVRSAKRIRILSSFQYFSIFGLFDCILFFLFTNSCFPIACKNIASSNCN